jgi:oligopeptide/dipeptide ABC transporter ATP-binding protein
VLLSIEQLTVEFPTHAGLVRAVNKVSLSIGECESLGLVGESGCGKTMTALSILGLTPSYPGKVVSGSIRYQGEDLLSLSEKKLRKIRGHHISMIFQEPGTALSPVSTIGQQLIEVIRRHKKLLKQEAHDFAVDQLRKVFIAAPEKRMNYYPHELSGGMKQRVMIAMALSCHPKLLIADEPTTALDVTTQAQVLYQIHELKKYMNMSLLLATHDLGVVAQVCDRVAVMYCGEIVEVAAVKELFATPHHPYTRGLLDSIPVMREVKVPRLAAMKGTLPDPLWMPNACRFAPRCPRAQARCFQEKPELKTVQPARSGAQVACFYPYEA